MGGAISPVNAPSFSQKTSCAPMAMLLPRAASTAAEIAVNGGAITMSQCRAPPTSGTNPEKNARVSACVLNIFQFPAITRRRFVWLICFQIFPWLCVFALCTPNSAFVAKGFDTRQLPPAKKLQRGPSARGYVRDLVRHPGLMHCRNGIAAAHNRSSTGRRGGRHCLRYLQCAFRKCRHLKNTHWSVPHNRLGPCDFRGVSGNRLRANIQPHLIRGG